MKGPLTLILGVALLLDVALFLGVGFGTGALSITTVNGGNANTNYVVNQANVGTSFGDGISWQVTMPSVASGSPMTTSLLAGYQSTPLSFGFNAYSKGDCGNTGQPVWAPGVGADYGFYVISFGGAPFTGLLDGSSFASTTSLSVSSNSSVTPEYCFTNLAGADTFTPGLGNSGTLYQSHTLVLTGIYPQATLTVSLVLFFTHCTGNVAGSGNACNAANSPLNTAQGGPNGGGQLIASTSTTVQSGYGTATVNNPGNLVGNGGTISVTLATGYAGPSGWHVSLLCPTPRTSSSGGCTGGQGDPRFANQSVGNDCAACTVTWTVPSGTSQNSSTAGWNTWEVDLYNGLLNIGYAPVTVNIQPPTAPTTPLAPAVTFASGGNFLNPQAGNTLTFTIYANASSQSGPIGSIQVWAYYLLPGQNPVNEPSCGASWVTTKCPYGQTLGAAQVTSNGANGLIGTFSFVVTPPAGATQIGLLAESFTGGQQGSPIVSYLVQIAPSNCVQGQPQCSQTHAGAALWALVGPYLFAAAFVLAAAFAAVLLPTVSVWVRVALPAATLAVFAALLWLQTLQGAFLSGGPLA